MTAENDLIERDGIWYKKFSNKPITGEVETYYSSGQLYSIRNYKNGKREGLSEILS